MRSEQTFSTKPRIAGFSLMDLFYAAIGGVIASSVVTAAASVGPIAMAVTGFVVGMLWFCLGTIHGYSEAILR